MIKGFRDFITKGNLVETAVGLVMALAVVALVNALITDIITPIIGAIVGEPSFSDLTFSINGSEFLYGDFINALITFVSIGAAVYFFIVMPYQRFQERRGVTSTTKECPHCLQTVPLNASRCAFCTSELGA
jgi:large conductance mechanosensitive channel